MTLAEVRALMRHQPPRGHGTRITLPDGRTLWMNRNAWAYLRTCKTVEDFNLDVFEFLAT